MDRPNETRVSTVEDRAAVLTVLVRAFESDPALRFMFPDHDQYRRSSPAFFGYLFDKRVVHNTVWVTTDLAAVSMWSPPHDRVSDAQRALDDAGWGALTAALDPGVVARIDAYDAAVEDLLPGGSYWYLGMLASTRRGAGASVMRAGLDCVRDAGGFAVLETTNPTNRGYYSAHGWREIGSVVASPVPEVWVFRQDG